MRRFEYRTIEWGTVSGPEGTRDEWVVIEASGTEVRGPGLNVRTVEAGPSLHILLNRLGMEGWDLVALEARYQANISIDPAARPDLAPVHYLKRELPEPRLGATPCL